MQSYQIREISFIPCAQVPLSQNNWTNVNEFRIDPQMGYIFGCGSFTLFSLIYILNKFY